MVLLWEVYGRLITEKELEDYVTNCPTKHENKIGNKKQAIEAVRNLGWCEKYTIEEMKAAFSNDGGHPICRKYGGRTYYWSGYD
jgi:hypothetical protein